VDETVVLPAEPNAVIASVQHLLGEPKSGVSGGSC
jgi:hypothetical protein